MLNPPLPFNCGAGRARSASGSKPFRVSTRSYPRATKRFARRSTPDHTEADIDHVLHLLTAYRA